MLVQILVDNPDSWIVPYATKLRDQLKDLGHESVLLHAEDEVKKGDILCLLSCEHVFKNLSLNKHNLVVHESELPKGKGWSPLTWQILEGKNDIAVTLFEAGEKVDSGIIYDQTVVRFSGHELIQELREGQGNATIYLILKFVADYPIVKGREQKGESTYYVKRKPTDSKLDINQTIKQQFNLLRVVDNSKYPAYFELDGMKYVISINKVEK